MFSSYTLFSTCRNTLDLYTEWEAPEVSGKLQEFKGTLGRRGKGRNSNRMGLQCPHHKVVGNVIAGSLVLAFPGNSLMPRAGERTLAGRAVGPAKTWLVTHMLLS